MRDPLACALPGVFPRALEHEAVEAIARVWVVRPDRLVDDAGEAEPVGLLDRLGERRVVARAAEDLQK